ncbi:hypothetical protein GCM10010112_48230 [Actinoplanes lobatus]|uniref:Glycosyltransferase RgtA/B/C/D-like domain-containing protein n=1 Tax=Actinoplanes lobatus TaxID=113568 RepID=A0A7W7MGV2_9ACTN|nr:hypothetical protein [Actinoplanes lobatus]MBB4749779.1 hypothetical protein [Actinoplanes lobatus]GGN76208.1 hypothetical protein GCM10010112_48230 [Actinoplanes lobatus]GIE38514.1 hypothetical protein Alo02nite_14120 [Actinoplanes lobatus]
MTAAAVPATRAWRIDPVHAVAAVLIAASVAWRALITRRGYLTIDDFPILSQADASGLTPGHLLSLYNNHLMPGGRLIVWIAERMTGYEYWPYAALMMIGQLAVGITFYRLLRLMLPAGWALLVPLTLFLFNPLTLEVTAWWAVGVNLLPMQLAMILAIGAQVRYVRTGANRHLVALGAAVLFGMFFFEKALFAIPMVFLVTLFLYAPGGPLRAVFTTIRRWWKSWAVLTAVALVYLAAYLGMSTSGSTLRRPSSPAEVGAFFAQYFGESLSPALFGGPWTWLGAGDGTPVVAPQPAAVWVSWALTAVLVVGTVWWRRWVAVRAWSLLVVFTALAGGLIAATRLGSALSGVAGLVPRYLGDVLPLAALCVGVAVCGLRAVDDTPQPPDRKSGQLWFVALVVLIASSVYSGVGFDAEWRHKIGRDYLSTAEADLALAEAGTVFMDQPVPEAVVPSMSYPWNMQSKFFGPLEKPPIFVTEARRLSIFDDAGHVRPAWVDGVSAKPGPVAGCGYRATGGKPVTIELDGSVQDYWQVVRISYLSDRDTSASIQVGRHVPRSFDIHRGLNAMFLLMLVEGDEAELKVDDPAANLCTDEIDIGALVPQPVG